MPTEEEYREAYNRIQNNILEIGQDMGLLGTGINFGGFTPQPSGSLGLQDFTTYTAVDQNSDLTITANKIEYDTMRRDADTYVVKDFGADFFDGDFEVHFESEMTACQTQNATYMTTFSVVNSTLDVVIADDRAHWHQLSQANSTRKIIIGSWEDNLTDQRNSSGTTWPLTWFEFSRTGSTLRLKGYDTAQKQNLITNLSIPNVTVTPFRYFYALAARNSDSFPTATQTGYIQNVDFKVP